MPRLQILHHKSYHPYNEKNKQRVREDEAKAREEELAREQQAIEANSEARLNALRKRAGSPGDLPDTTSTREPKSDSLLERHQKEKARAEKRERRQKDRLDFDFPSDTKRREERRAERGEARDRDLGEEREKFEDKWQSGGHLNLFADLESGITKTTPAPVPTAAELEKRKAEQEADKFTMYLGRPERETKPWYTDRDLRHVEEKGDQAEYRRARDKRRDIRSKDRNDPLTGINQALASQRAPDRASRGPPGGSERERALALLAKKNGRAAPAAGWETPRSSWSEHFERQKDTAGNRFHAETWDRRRSGRSSD